jgi:hypothetical protein
MTHLRPLKARGLAQIIPEPTKREFIGAVAYEGTPKNGFEP